MSKPYERELDVALLAAQVSTVREIAGALGVSEHTVKTHLRRVYARCGVKNRAELMWWLLENGKSAERRLKRRTSGRKPM
jgi:DNA-binding CsgD family transcriptional regulator